MALHYKFLLIAGCSGLAIAQPAAAQDAAGAGAETYSTDGDIVVTANKRTQRLVDVPAAVSAVSGEALEAINATQLSDYVARVPGLIVDNVSFSNGATQLTIRGLNTGTGGNPTVGIYIDDSPFGGSSNNSFGGSTVPDLDPQDLERVEVLRGPQGTLYGAGSLGGLFKYVTKAPDPDRFTARLQVDAQEVDAGGIGYGVRGATNIPVSNTAALRVSGYYRRDPGFIDNITTGETDVNDARFYGGRAALGVDLGENWKIRLSAVVQKQEADGSAVQDHSLATQLPKYGELRQARAPGTGATSQFIGDYSLSVEGDLGFAVLTSTTSIDRQTVGFDLDVSSSYSATLANNGIPDAGATIITDADLDKITQEIRLTSASGSGLSWQVGTFHTDEDANLRQYLDVFELSTGDVYPAPLPTLLDARVKSSFEEFALFGNLSYEIAPNFDVMGGIRYSHNKQTRLQTNVGPFLGGDATFNGKSTDESTTYLLSASYHFSKDTMAYARFATGYRPGGPNNPVAGTPASYGPDRTTNYEIGFKTVSLDRTLSFDISAFWIAWDDIQLNQRNSLGLNFNGNGGKARSRGIEAALTWAPIDGLTLDGNIAYTDAELTQDLPAAPPTVGFDGDKLPSVPKWASQFGISYETPISNEWTGVLGGSWRYVGKRDGYFGTVTQPRFELDDYHVVDLRLGVRNEGFSATAFVKNLTNGHGQVAAYTLGSDFRVAVIQPRTFGISLAQKF